MINFPSLCLPNIIAVLILVNAVSACASNIHSEFPINVVNGSKNPEGSIEKQVVSLAYHERSKHLIVGYESGNIDIWDAKEARSKHEVKAHEYRANWISFTSDGSKFFSNSYFEPSTKLWSAKTGELFVTIPDTRGPVCATPDDDIYLIGTSHSSTTRFFDLARQTLLPDEYESSGVVETMAMDKASGRIAIGTASGTIEVWKFGRVDGKPILEWVAGAKPYATGNWVVGLLFSPGGDSLYSVARSGAVDEWTSVTMTKRRSIQTTLGAIHSSAFLPDKSLVVLAGASDKQGFRAGAVELISLSTGKSTQYRSTTNFPVAAFLPDLSSLIMTHFRSIQVHPLESK